MIQELEFQLLQIGKPKESCLNYDEFSRVREEMLMKSPYYSTYSWDAGFVAVFCEHICKYRSKDFILVSELSNGDGDFEKNKGKDGGQNYVCARLEELLEAPALIDEINKKKYYMSERVKQDVGYEKALENYREHNEFLWNMGFKLAYCENACRDREGCKIAERNTKNFFNEIASLEDPIQE